MIRNRMCSLMVWPCLLGVFLLGGCGSEDELPQGEETSSGVGTTVDVDMGDTPEPGDPPPTDDEPSADDESTSSQHEIDCDSDVSFFETQLWAPTMSIQCAGCHQSGALAGETRMNIP